MNTSEFTRRISEPENMELVAQDQLKLLDNPATRGSFLKMLNLPENEDLSRETILDAVRAIIRKDAEQCEIWRNDTYQVAIYNRDKPPHPNWPRMIHLSIKRIDREAIRDWRELQEIKNRLIGRENEAVELFPAESRRVDMANQYHLFVLADPKMRFPFGFTEGFIADQLEGSISKQRPL